MKEKYLYNNPEFAYKLFSTVGLGNNKMSDYEQKLCKEIWEECNMVRSKVLIKCVQICGTADTPLARYVRAKAWSWNLVCYSNNAINAIIDYLSHELYEDAFKENLLFDNYQMRKNHHLFNTYLDLGNAYEKAKKFDKALEIYNESKKFMNSHIPYVKIANRLRILKRYDEALEELNKAKNSKFAKYPKTKEFNINYIDLNVIDRYYEEILKFKNKHKK